MADNPQGPVCVTRCGPDWIDKGTMCLARSRTSSPQNKYVCGSTDDQAAKAVLAVLSDRAIAKLKFTIDACPVKPEFYKQVASLIARNKILVQYERSLGTAAYYDPNKNLLQVGFTTASTLTKRALVAHECTHTVFDAQNYSRATVQTSEAAAHVAQLIFFTVHSPDAPLESDDPKRNEIYQNAGFVAEKILKGRTPTADEYQHVKSAVARHPDYSNWRTLSGWNGV